MRKDTEFPLDDNLLLEFLRSAWENGWLDEYSDDHFLIKAIEGRLDGFVGMEQLIANNANLFGFVMPDGSVDWKEFALNFCVNFSAHMEVLEHTFGTDHIRRFVMDQMSAGKKKYNEDTFFQAMSEVSVLCFLARNRWTQAIYEPPVDKGANNKNPEARFIWEYCPGGDEAAPDAQKKTVTVNVEVKSPKFPHDSHADERTIIPTVLLTDEGRSEIQTFCKENGLVYMSPRVQQLKEFIKSAAEKFSIPGPNEFNLLYINWSYRDFPSNSFLEAWSLLTNELNGILTHPEAAKEFGILPEHLQKITAVIVYTESLEGLVFADLRYIWQRNGAGPRFRMWVLDETLREAERSDKSRLLFNVTHMNPDDPSKQRLMVDLKFKALGDIDRVSKLSLELLRLIHENAKV